MVWSVSKIHSSATCGPTLNHTNPHPLTASPSRLWSPFQTHSKLLMKLSPRRACGTHHPPRVNKSPLLPSKATGVNIHQPLREADTHFNSEWKNCCWDSNCCLFTRHLCLQLIQSLRAIFGTYGGSKCMDTSPYLQPTSDLHAVWI